MDDADREIRIGDMVQTGVCVMHEWKPMYKGRVVQMSSDRSSSQVDIGSPWGATPWIIFERTDHLRPT